MSFENLLDTGQPEAEPGSSPYLDSVGQSIVETVASFEVLATIIAQSARAFSAQAEEFQQQVARLKAIAGLVAPQAGEH